MKPMLILAVMLLAPLARADVSDSGNLSIGGNGVIVGSMTMLNSITTSSITLSTGGASVYALTSSSGVHILNGELRLEPGAYIRWPDLKTSTTSSTGSGNGAVMVLSSTTASGSTTNTSSSAGCISTVTFTLAQSDRVVVWFAGNADNWPSAYGACLGFRVDGEYNTPNTSSSAATICTSNYSANISGPSVNASFARPTTVLSAGSHSICLFLFAYAGGTASVSAPAQFGVYELNTGGL